MVDFALFCTLFDVLSLLRLQFPRATFGIVACYANNFDVLRHFFRLL